MASFSLSTLPWKTQLAIFVGLALGAAGVFYYFHEMPAQARIAVHEKEIAGVQTQIEKGAATARQLPEFRQKVADLQTRLESLRPILPDEKDAADLLRRVHTLAMQSNLTILGFRPQSVNTRTLHAEWPINLELEGTYHNLGLFLDRVSKVPRIINVSGLVIEARSDPQPNATITVKCTATTFVLIDAPAAAPEAGKKTRAKAPKKS